MKTFEYTSLKIFLGSVLLLTLIVDRGLAQKILDVDSTKSQKIRIDPFGAVGANASDILEKVNYIPLETTKESTFGYIGQLEVTKDYFVILDPITNSILVFTKQGKFHAKIAIENSNKNLEKDIQSFAINAWTKQIVFQQGLFSKISKLYYNYDGTLVETQILGEGAPHSGSSFFLAPDVTISYIGYSPNPKFPPYLLTYLTKFKDINARGLHYEASLNFQDIYQGYSLPHFSNSGIDSVSYFTREYDYSIYKISANSIERRFSFIFPASSSLPSNFISDRNWDKKRRQYIDDHKKVIYLLNNCYQIKDNLMFRTTVADRPSAPNLIYNVRSGILIDYNHVSTDALAYYLPISRGYNYSNTGFIACDGECLYTSFSSLDMFTAYETNKSKNIMYSPVLKKYFTTGSRQDNPVILQLTPKKSF